MKKTVLIFIFSFVAALVFSQEKEQSLQSHPVNEIIANDAYIKTRNGIGHFYQVVSQKKKATVAFVGGSITYNPGWRDKTCTYLQEMFPDVTFNFIKAAIPSLGSLPHVFRLQKDLPQLKEVDLMFLEAAVNDRANGTDSLIQLRCLEGVVRQAKTNNRDMDIIMMSFADPEKTKDYDAGKTPAEVANHEAIAAHYQLPSINLAKLVRDKMRNDEFSWQNDFKDLHPSPFGQGLYFSVIKQLLFTTYNTKTIVPVKSKLPKPINKNYFARSSYYNIHNAKPGKDFSIDENWQPQDGLKTREGFVNVPVLMATKPGAEFSLPFKGNAIGIAIVSGGDAGMIEYSIDGTVYKAIDLFTRWSGQTHLPWYLLLATDLKNKSHLLKIKISETKNSNSKGNACRIVNFLINQ